jgi:hypothetical protein
VIGRYWVRVGSAQHLPGDGEQKGLVQDFVSIPLRRTQMPLHAAPVRLRRHRRHNRLAAWQFVVRQNNGRTLSASQSEDYLGSGGGSVRYSTLSTDTVLKTRIDVSGPK